VLDRGWVAPHLYFSNPDFLFSGRHNAPRLASGSFQLTLATLYQHMTGRSLPCTFYGKPLSSTYQWAEALIHQQ
jgi:ribonucleotide monophosphatase NagD (HAD superfamily)